MKQQFKRMSAVLLVVVWLPIQDIKPITITFPEIIQIGSHNTLVRE